MTNHPLPRRAGLSLLEVLAALAIFFLSIVAISQMVDQATRTAQRAARLSKAGTLADSLMAEIAAGVRPLSSSGQESLNDPEAGWVASVQVEPEGWSQLAESIGSGVGLHRVHVMVAWVNEAGAPEAEYTLTRVLLDPALRQSSTTGIPKASDSSTGTAAPTGSGGSP